MALLEIREYGKDDVLLKVCKPVKELTPRLKTLIGDMLDTMYDADGVGLAAPQVGVLRRICVIDVGEGPVYSSTQRLLRLQASRQVQRDAYQFLARQVW